MRITEIKMRVNYKGFEFSYYDEWEKFPGEPQVGSKSFIVRAERGDLALEMRGSGLLSSQYKLYEFIDQLFS